MTEYGRGPGSEPWHPEDPLYGDDGYGEAHQGQSTYGDQSRYYPQQYAEPQGYDEWGTGRQPVQGQYPGQYPLDGGTGQQPVHDPTGQYSAQGQYGQQGQPYPGHQPEYESRQPFHGDPYPHSHQQGHQLQHGQYPQQPVHPQQQPGHGGQPPYGQQHDGGWDTGQHGGWDTGQHGQSAYGSGDPYGSPQQPQDPGGDPYGSPRQDQSPGPGAESAGHYGAPGARPAPEPPRRRAEPEQEPVPHTDWDPGPDQGEHAFFADTDDDDDPDDGPRGSRGRGERRGRGGKSKKRRSGCACLVVSLVLVGGVGGVGYFGYSFYEDHFGPAPDYSGEGTGETVSVEIPKGSSGYSIGQKLKDAGVVKSVDAFVAAQKKNPKGQSIQDGVYSLGKEMSAASAVEMMLDPKSHNNLIIAEGRRNAWVYQQIDTRLHVKAGTTKAVAKKKAGSLGLPDWANKHKNVKDPLEGFLFPASYPVAEGMKPEDVLKKMVGRAVSEYGQLDLDAEAKRLHVDGPWQVITIASLVQVEGKTHDDFRKMSEVVYNRLKSSNTETNQLLQFDSAFNYLKGQSKIKISESEINSNMDPYNTYTQRGLTPGPISNPGSEALAAALKPTDDGWLYFVATDGESKTEFAKTYAEFQRLKDKYNEQSAN